MSSFVCSFPWKTNVFILSLATSKVMLSVLLIRFSFSFFNTAISWARALFSSFSRLWNLKQLFHKTPFQFYHYGLDDFVHFLIGYRTYQYVIIQEKKYIRVSYNHLIKANLEPSDFSLERNQIHSKKLIATLRTLYGKKIRLTSFFIWRNKAFDDESATHQSKKVSSLFKSL